MIDCSEQPSSSVNAPHYSNTISSDKGITTAITPLNTARSAIPHSIRSRPRGIRRGNRYTNPTTAMGPVIFTAILGLFFVKSLAIGILIVFLSSPYI